MQNSRNSSRFDDMGRFEAPELCALAGTLENISKDGCCIHYDFPVVVDLEEDYKSKIIFARAASDGQFELLCHPMWVKTEGEGTDVGFKILPSQDYARLLKYVAHLNIENQPEDEEILEDFHTNVSVCKITR